MALYLEHFGLAEAPFRITPHTDFFFDGAERGATLEALMYAVLHDEGIVKVSGEVGSGKTMLCRMLMERLPPEVDTIYLATPSLARDEILQAIADDLDLQLSERRTVALRELQEQLIKLYAAGRRVVVLIDEAHVMPEDTLEQVRLLSNLESSRHKLLQIVLFGQPELDHTLAKASLRQLRDRITHGFRMRPLASAEVGRYLSFRMRAAGYKGPEVFTPQAVARLARASEGLTRRINILADKSLLAAYSESSHGITEHHVKAAVADSEFAAAVPRAPRKWRPAALLVGVLALGAMLGAGVQWLLAAREAAVAQPKASAVTAPNGADAAKAREELEMALDAQDEADSIEEIALQQTQEQEPLLSPRQRQRLQAYASPQYKLLAERIAATRELLEHAADERYCVELFVTDNGEPGRMERFLLRARDMVPISEVFVVPMAGPSNRRLRVVYGTFDSAKQALEAERHLPPKYQREFRPEPRTFAELRKQM